MYHTKLFRKFPCKFGINKNDDGSYFLFCGKERNIIDFVASDPLYDVSDVDNIDSGYIVSFRYNDIENDDYSENVEFNTEELKNRFASISGVVFVRKRLPHTINQVTRCAYYSVRINNENDCKSIEDYVFDRFGYIKMGESKINNQTVLRFTNYEEYCF